MSSKGNDPADGRPVGVGKEMDALDVLEERLDRISDRLNALWDKVVGLEEEE